VMIDAARILLRFIVISQVVIDRVRKFTMGAS
jgi:hypothetical protein